MTRAGTRAGTGKPHTELARKVVDYVRQQNLQEGERVREQPLADHFSVSRTPIRGALALLAERGLLRYAPNQGYSLAIVPETMDDAPVDLPPTEEERLFHAIVRDRLARRLSDQVTVTEIMRRYDTTRATVTRVLVRMGEDGLIERGDGQSWAFGPTLDSLAAMEESHRFRELIEPAAILEPGFRIDAELFAHIRRSCQMVLESDVQTVEARRLHDADAAFHNALASCCGNRFLAQAIRQQTTLRRLSENTGGVNRHRLVESCREHIAILDLMEEGHMQQAAEALHQHINAAQGHRPRVCLRGIPPLASKRQ